MTDKNLDLELDNNSKEVVKYIHKYLEKNDKCYHKLLEIVNHPKLENEFSDLQWALIIEEAWRLAYIQALEDNFISLEERKELNNIHQLALNFRNTPGSRQALNFRILRTFRHLVEIDKKEDLYERDWKPQPVVERKDWYPKPTPWDTINNK